MFDRDGIDGILAKLIHAVHPGGPDVAFTIFEKTLNSLIDEAVRLSKYVYPALMDVQKSAVPGPNP